MEIFANPQILFYLALAACFVALVWYLGNASRRAALRSLFKGGVYGNLIPPELAARRRLTDILFLAGLFFLFIALAGPQWGRGKIMAQANYSQAVIAVDVSNSMLAQDVKPDRISAARMMVSMLLESIAGSRAGLIAFTSQAYLQCPITTDIAALKTLAAALSTKGVPTQGTALAPALTLAARMLSIYPGKKALVLITDGEDHNPQDIQAALALARENGIKVIAVGIGSAEGELIPITGPGGEKTYKKDSEGKTIITKLDEKTLISFAQATGGVYIRFTTPQQTADEIAAQLAALDKAALQTSRRAVYKNRYQIALAIAVLLILSSILIPLRKVE